MAVIWPAYWRDSRDYTGGLDFIGDVHGCADELIALLRALGYTVTLNETPHRRFRISAPAGRKAVLLGDLVDRGPKIADAVRVAMALEADDAGMCVVGNHDHLLVENLRDVLHSRAEGLSSSLQQLEREPPDFRQALTTFFMGLPSYIWFDDGAVAASHAGLMAGMLGENTPFVHDFATRRDPPAAPRQSYDLAGHWSTNYRGKVSQVYGHYRVNEALWRNGTMCLDTACVYGGRLTALRWPERELVAVQAQAAYALSRKIGRPTPLGTEHFLSPG